MVYRKRQTSRTLEHAELRASGLTAIDPAIDFGNDYSLNNLNDQITQLREKLNTYNTALTNVDTIRNEIKEMEKELGDLSERMLIGVAFRYGKDSPEYQMAGGVRKSDRIRKSSVNRLKTENETTAQAL